MALHKKMFATEPRAEINRNFAPDLLKTSEP